MVDVDKLRWSPSLVVEELQGHLVIADEVGYQFLQHPIFVAMSGALLEGATQEAICSSLDAKFGYINVMQALRRLQSSGLVSRACDLSDQAAAHRDLVGRVDRGFARPELAAVAAQVIGEGMEAGALEASLEQVGVPSGAPDESFLVVLADDYLRPELEEINRRRLEIGRPWLLARPRGLSVLIGPLFDGPGCWSCLENRLRANRPLEQYLERWGGDQRLRVSAVAEAPGQQAFVANVIAGVAARFLQTGNRSGLEHRIREVSLPALTSVDHHLVTRPQCSTCGTPRDPSWTLVAPELRPVPKAWTGDGGHRSMTPSQVLDRCEHHVSRISGVVNSLVDLVPDDPHLHAYTSGHNFSLNRETIYNLKQNIRGRSGGKGMTSAQARVSALCEAFERYSGMFQGDEVTERGSYASLADRAIHPDKLLGYSEAQQRGRAASLESISNSAMQYVTRPFDDQFVTDWTAFHSLVDGGQKLLPTAFAYFDHPAISATRTLMSCSNGMASGACLEEAVVQGACELIERDAVGIWFYNRLQRRRIDLDSVDHPFVREFVDYHERKLSRRSWCLDLTTDIGIPVIAAVSERIGGDASDIVFGLGAHLDPKVALLRAMTEVNQFLPGLLEGKDGKVKYGWDDADTLDWFQSVTLESDPYLAPDPAAAPVPIDALPSLATDDFASDIKVIADRLSGVGVDMLIHDMTRPDVDFPVVRVVAPGLCHMWRRLGVQRLYDSPVKMGLRSEPCAEADLNPRSVFF